MSNKTVSAQDLNMSNKTFSAQDLIMSNKTGQIKSIGESGTKQV